MTEPGQSLGSGAAELRRRLHAVNDELSIAILELELLLDDVQLEPAARSAVGEALHACRRAAATQREIWAELDEGATAKK